MQCQQARKVDLGEHCKDFYSRFGPKWHEGFRDFFDRGFEWSSHAALRSHRDILHRTIELSPGIHGLDAGCALGLSMNEFSVLGCEMVGVDLVEQNIAMAKELYPNLASRLHVADLRIPLHLESETCDFVFSDCAISYMDPDVVKGIVLPQFARLIRPGGVLTLVFKHSNHGNRLHTFFDPSYGEERMFQLHNHQEMLEVLENLGCHLIHASSPWELGCCEFVYDSRGITHCIFWARKSE